jgi:hypothetical protein
MAEQFAHHLHVGAALALMTLARMTVVFAAAADTSGRSGTRTSPALPT